MTEGDVILTPVPQADGQIKNRPAVILREMPPHVGDAGNTLLCADSEHSDRSPHSLLRGASLTAAAMPIQMLRAIDELDTRANECNQNGIPGPTEATASNRPKRDLQL